MKKTLLLLILLAMPLASAATVNFEVTDTETSDPVPNAVIVLSGISDPDFSSTKVTDSNGEAQFNNVPGSAFYSYVIVHDNYESYEGVQFIAGTQLFSIAITPLPQDAWSDVYIEDDNIGISWHSFDQDRNYEGGERMNQRIEVTNIKDSGYVRFDWQTGVNRIVYTSDGTETDWASSHQLDQPMYIKLKPDGWLRTTLIDSEGEMCVGNAEVYVEGTTLDLGPGESVCHTQTRNDHVVPYYLDGEYYIYMTANYKEGGEIHQIDGTTQNFTITNSAGENHAPLLNQIENELAVEGTDIYMGIGASDPDGDDITITPNDPRFEFVRQDSPTSYLYIWHTESGDAGIYDVEVTVSDGEYEVSETATITVLDTIDIQLEEGLNLISLPYLRVIGDLEDNPIYNDSIKVQTKLIEDKLTSVFYYDQGEWNSYNPDKPDFLNSLHNLDESMGVWLNMQEATTMTLNGLPEYPVEINLHPGLNMIAYPSISSTTPSDALENVYGTYNNIVTYDAQSGEWLSYNPDKPDFLNSLSTMEPGQGFWVLTDQGVTWEFDGTQYNTI